MNRSTQRMLGLATAAAVFAMLNGCTRPTGENPTNALQTDQMLTVEAIFRDEEYKPEEPGKVRWLEDGSGYTALETAAGYEDAVLEKDDIGDDIKAPEDIVFYDPRSLERSILIPIAHITPEGAERALVIDDYHWSDDRTRLLIYTNSKKVWRTKSRGDYWVLDIASASLW